MKTVQNNAMLVLVPHRDIRRLLREWSAGLFSAGLPGAWSFPWVAPLAFPDSPLSGGEMKTLARKLRQNNGQFWAKKPVSVPFQAEIPGTEQIYLYGLALEASIGAEEERGALSETSLPIIGAALHYGPLPDGLPPPPEISFRAAALANMSFSPLQGMIASEKSCFGPRSEGSPEAQRFENTCFSFEWSIGTLYWLPKKSTGL